MYATGASHRKFGRDPETRYTKNGTMNVSFSVAHQTENLQIVRDNRATDHLVQRHCLGQVGRNVGSVGTERPSSKGSRVLFQGVSNKETTQIRKAKTGELEITADDVLWLVAGRAEEQRVQWGWPT